MHAALVTVKNNSDPESANGFKNFISSTGYRRVELKTDGEPALIDVAKTTKEIFEIEVILKNPPRHGPNANGAAERAVGEFKEQLRATKLSLER